MNRPESVQKKELLSGARDTFPLLLGALPFGLIYGAVAATSGVSMLAAVAMSAFVFAGASQFIAVGLVAAQTPVAIIVLTTFIVNLRHMLYSATLLPYLKNLPQKWRIPLAFWLTDETFAVTVHRFQKNDSSACKHWYQLGSSIAMYLNWQFWCFLGLALGNRIPDAQSWGLDVAMPVTFIGMIIPFVKTMPIAVCVLTAGAASLLTLADALQAGDRRFRLRRDRFGPHGAAHHEREERGASGMTANEVWMIAGMMAVTFGIRYFLFALADRIRMAPWIEGALKFIPPAVLTAITLPAVLLPKGDWQVSFSNPYLVSAIAATAAGILTRNLLATIAIGLAVFFAYRFFLF